MDRMACRCSKHPDAVGCGSAGEAYAFPNAARPSLGRRSTPNPHLSVSPTFQGFVLAACCVAALLPLSSASAAPDSIVTFNEIHYHPADEGPEWIELHNQMGTRIDLGGWSLRGGVEFTFPEGTIVEPGGYLVVSVTAGSPTGALGPWSGRLDNAGEEIRLHERWGRMMDRVNYGRDGSWPSSPDGTGPTLAKRHPDAASEPARGWAASAEPDGTPGAENFPGLPVTAAAPPFPFPLLTPPVVINEILYHARPTYADPGADPPVAYATNPSEFIELHNPGTTPIYLEGWRLSSGIDYTFPANTILDPGGYLVVDHTQFQGTLSNSSDRVVLRNAANDIIDEVTYVDGGRWPEMADGGGSSLERIHPAAPSRAPESWRASVESTKLGAAAWHQVTYTVDRTRSTTSEDASARLPGANPANTDYPTNWNEFLLGLLDAGECLIDDVSVTESGTELIQNGSFEGDALNAVPARWRCLGTHRLSRVVANPDGPGKVLHLIADGALEHTTNTVTTTLANGHVLNNQKTYTISFKAKWLTGSPQLNSRLYLGRAIRTSILPQPPTIGTPGAPNSTRVENPGPAWDGLRHSPLVPAAGEPIAVHVTAADAEGVASATLHYRSGTGSWQTVAMSLEGTEWRGQIPGQTSNRIVQFYVSLTDAAGQTTFAPAAGPDSRALVRVGDSGVSSVPLKNKMRLIMTAADANALHDPLATVSDFRWGGTVIYNDREVWYDVGVRLRASPYGRNGPHTGWNIRFPADHPFRGVHKTISVDGTFRAPRGDGSGWLDSGYGPTVNEMLFNLIANRAGGIPASYDDVAYFQTPRTNEPNRRAQLKLSRFNNNWLDEAFPNGGEGLLFKQELVYYPTSTTDGNPESPKQAYNQVKGVDIRPLGYTSDPHNKEAYRFNYLVQNHADRDDFSPIMRIAPTFIRTGTTLLEAAEGTLDVDQWMRSFGLAALCGVYDFYNNGLPHNVQLYARPSDGRVLLFPWDADHAFYPAPTSSLFGLGDGNLSRIIALAANKQRYGRHLYELCQTAFSNEYLDPWIEHYCQLAGKTSAGSPAVNYVTHLRNWIRNRRNYALQQLERTGASAPFTAAPFEITTQNGENFAVGAPSVVLEGRGGVTLWHLEASLNGQPAMPVSFDWTGAGAAALRWRLTLPLALGANSITLTAKDSLGAIVGTDSITVTNTSAIEPAHSTNLVLAKLFYHPETDAEEEYLELLVIGSRTVDLTGVTFSSGIDFAFPAGTQLQPGQRLIVAQNLDAFTARFGEALPPGTLVLGPFANGTGLSNSGERLALLAADGSVIFDFSYSDRAPWPATADGEGPALVLRRPTTHPDLSDASQWRPSRLAGGSPGTDDAEPRAAYPSLTAYALLSEPTVDGEGFHWVARLGADAVTLVPEVSTDLRQWLSGAELATLLRLQPAGFTQDGEIWHATRSSVQSGILYFRLKISE